MNVKRDSVKREMISKLFGLLGDRGWDVIRKALQAEIEDHRARLKELQSFQNEISGKSPKGDASAQTGNLFSQRNDMAERVARILEQSTADSLSLGEIHQIYRATAGQDVAKGTIGNCLSKFKGVRFRQHGQRRWSKWSLIREET